MYTDITNDNISASAGIIFSKLDSATVMGVAATQTVTGAKTFASDKLKVAGAGAGVATINNTNTANNQTCTIPYVGANATFVMTTSSGNTGPIAPLGSIIAWYNYSAAAEITLDTTYWNYCNGQTITFGDGVSRVLPDLSNRYLVGYGTEAGGNIGSAAWDAPPANIKGNASHTQSFTHQHANTLAASDISVAATGTATIGTIGTTNQSTDQTDNQSADHIHGAGDLIFHVAEKNLSAGSALLQFYDDAGSLVTMFDAGTTPGGAGTACPVNAIAGNQVFHTAGGSGSTDGVSADHHHHLAHTHDTAIGNPSVSVSGTGTHGSGQHTLTNVDWTAAAVSIQPRSIEVRFIMRTA